MKCSFCGSDRVRISKLHASDFLRLIFLQYPVRCHACYERSYVSLATARRIRRAKKLRHEG
jgi:hypothetical protein